MAGIMLGQDGNIYAVGRNGQVSELLTGKRKSLTVKSIKGAGDGNSIEITTKNNKFTWDADTITRKLNDNTRKAKILGYGR